MAEFSSQLAPFTQRSPELSHGWPTTCQEATSEVLVWLYKLVLETLAA